MSTFATSPGYSELRPAYVVEVAHFVTVTIPGVGTIAGQTFAGAMNTPAGQSAGAVTATVIGDGTARQILVTLPGQTVAGFYPQPYRWSVRRTDDGSNLEVAWGTLELTDPLAAA